MSDSVREALHTLRDNIRDEKGSVQRMGVRDNNDTRDAIATLLENEAALSANGGVAGWCSGYPIYDTDGGICHIPLKGYPDHMVVAFNSNGDLVDGCGDDIGCELADVERWKPISFDPAASSGSQALMGARDALREAAKQFRATGDIGHAAMCENHADELDRLRTAGDEGRKRLMDEWKWRRVGERTHDHLCDGPVETVSDRPDRFYDEADIRCTKCGRTGYLFVDGGEGVDFVWHKRPTHNGGESDHG